jgi:DNA-binding transcriptional ArsR family regulator
VVGVDVLLSYVANKHADLMQRFQALSDPTRYAMVERLAHGAQPVTELAEPFGMALPTVLAHLRVLESAGLIMTEKLGRSRICTLNGPALDEAATWLSDQADLWSARMARLDALALSLDDEEKTDD